MLKSYRIGGQHQKKVLAIVVCSILALFFDSEIKCELQYESKMTLSNWFTVYKFEEENNIYVDELSTDILRKCAQIEKSELKVVEKYFEKDLSATLTYVSNDMDDRFKDTVDYKNKEINNKKRSMVRTPG